MFMLFILKQNAQNCLKICFLPGSTTSALVTGTGCR